MPGTDTLVKLGRSALARHDWKTAYRALSGAARLHMLDGDGLEALADVAEWEGRLTEAINALEQAYETYAAAGDRTRAAAIALELVRTVTYRNQPSAAAGWRRRAESLLEKEPESAVHGELLIRKAQQARGAGKLDDALVMIQQAQDIGKKHANPDVEAAAMHIHGQLLVALGRVAEGMELVDDATAAAIGGELTMRMTGRLYCWTIALCSDLADYGRSSEWTESALRWCSRQSVTGFPGICRIHRAELMRLRGHFDRALSDAQQAHEELIDHNVMNAGSALGEVGLIRVRVGDLEGAEQALTQAHQLGGDCEPGLSLLLLARGDGAGAFASITRALEAAGAEPLQRRRYLPPLVTIALAAGNVPAMREAVRELEGMAAVYGTAALKADAAAAQGALDLHEGRVSAAITALQRAIAHWLEVDAPYEVAQCRVRLATALEREGEVAAARRELSAASTTFERVGAMPDLERTRRRVQQPSDGSGTATTEDVVFMFTDIVGSTELAVAIGDEAWTQLSAWHDRTLRAVFGEHGGTEIKHAGDGFLVSFTNVRDGLACASAIQQRMADHRREAGFAPRLRIGLHAGPARKVGDDYRGAELHVAARVAALAGPDEVLITTTSLPLKMEEPTAPPRTVALKGVPDPVQVVSIDWRRWSAVK